jgi:hypothetical protein
MITAFAELTASKCQYAVATCVTNIAASYFTITIFRVTVDAGVIN